MSTIVIRHCDQIIVHPLSVTNNRDPNLNKFLRFQFYFNFISSTKISCACVKKS